MKKNLIVLTLIALLIASCCPDAGAQTPTQSVDLNSLTPELQALVIAEQKEQQNDLAKVVMKYKNELTPEEIQSWGDLVNTSLMSVVESAEEFGKTEVGRFTLFIVGWKLIGIDFVRIFLGLLFIGMFTWLLVFSFKRTCIDRKILVKKENRGFMKYPKIKEYETVEPLFDGEGLGFIRIAHLLFFLIGIWITYAIMFT